MCSAGVSHRYDPRCAAGYGELGTVRLVGPSAPIASTRTAFLSYAWPTGGDRIPHYSLTFPDQMSAAQSMPKGILVLEIRRVTIVYKVAGITR